jgi:hypothetical protein
MPCPAAFHAIRPRPTRALTARLQRSSGHAETTPETRVRARTRSATTPRLRRSRQARRVLRMRTGGTTHRSRSASAEPIPRPGSRRAMRTRPTRDGQRSGSRRWHLPRQRRKHRRRLVPAEIRRNHSRGGRDALPSAECERLVQRAALGQLRRHRRHLRHRLVQRAQELLGPRQRDGRRRRHLPRPGREPAIRLTGA